MAKGQGAQSLPPWVTDATNSVLPLHEPCSSGRESAHSSLEKFEPTHVGCYESARFMVPMHGVKPVGATHEPCNSGRESAHSSFGEFEPTHVGCYEPVQDHGTNARRQTRRGEPYNLE